MMTSVVTVNRQISFKIRANAIQVQRSHRYLQSVEEAANCLKEKIGKNA